MNITEININLNQETNNCFDVFLQALKAQFPEFAQYTNQTFYFIDTVDQTVLQSWVDSYTCLSGSVLIETLNQEPDIIKSYVKPTITDNKKKGTVCVYIPTGEIYVCIDDSADKNIWRGQSLGELIRPIPPADKIDFFSDKSSIGFWPLYSDAKDSSGLYHGVETNITYEKLFDKATASSVNNGTIKINNLPTDNLTDVTVSGWIKWNGNNGVMPFGWNKYDIFLYSGIFGFNTARGDITGLDFTPYKNKYVYVVVQFSKGMLGKIFVNGVEQVLDKTKSRLYSPIAIFDKTFTIFGWKSGTGYRRFGNIGRLRMFNKALTAQEVQQLTIAEVNFIKSIGGTV